MTIRKIAGRTSSVAVSATTTQARLIGKASTVTQTTIQKLINATQSLIPKAHIVRQQLIDHLIYDPEGTGFRFFYDLFTPLDLAQLLIARPVRDTVSTADSLTSRFTIGRGQSEPGLRDHITVAEEILSLTIGFNRRFVEAALISERPALQVKKSRTDTISIDDLVVLVRGKPFDDTVLVGDIMRQVKFVGRSFSDTANMIDNYTLIDGSTYRLDRNIYEFISVGSDATIIRNSGDPLERISFFMDKVLDPDMELLDQLVIDYGKGLSDAVDEIELVEKQLAKIFADSASAASRALRVFGKNVFDQQTVVQSLFRSLINKQFNDLATMIDVMSLGDNLTYDSTKFLTDLVTVLDPRQLNIGKGFSNVVTAADALRKTPVKGLNEDLPLTEIINKYVARPLADSNAVSDYLFLGRFKGLRDSLSLIEDPIFYFGKLLNDAVSATDPFVELSDGVKFYGIVSKQETEPALDDFSRRVDFIRYPHHGYKSFFELLDPGTYSPYVPKQFTRTAKVGTYVNVPIVRTNLILYSEQFNALYWDKPGTTVVSDSLDPPSRFVNSGVTFDPVYSAVQIMEIFYNQPNNPYGTEWFRMVPLAQQTVPSSDADTLSEDTSAGSHALEATVTNIADGNGFSLSFFVKRISGRYIKLDVATDFYATFDLVDIKVVEQFCARASIQDVGDGWYLIQIADRIPTFIIDAAELLLIQEFFNNTVDQPHAIRRMYLTQPVRSQTIALKLLNNNLEDTYVGTGTDAFYVWGAQFELGDQIEQEVSSLNYIRTSGGQNSKLGYNLMPTDTDRFYAGSLLRDRDLWQTRIFGDPNEKVAFWVNKDANQGVEKYISSTIVQLTAYNTNTGGTSSLFVSSGTAPTSGSQVSVGTNNYRIIGITSVAVNSYKLSIEPNLLLTVVSGTAVRMEGLSTSPADQDTIRIGKNMDGRTSYDPLEVMAFKFLKQLYSTEYVADAPTDLVEVIGGISLGVRITLPPEFLIIGNSSTGIRRSGDTLENTNFIVLKTAKQGNSTLRANGNLFTSSEQLNLWTQTSITITANLVGGPYDNSSAVAERIYGTGGNVSHGISQTINTVSGSTYTISTYIQDSTSLLSIYLQAFIQQTGLTGYAWANFGPSGTIYSTSSTSSSFGINYGALRTEIAALARNWYRISFTVNVLTASSITAGFRLVADDTGDATWDPPILPLYGMNIWGAQLTALPYLTPYIQTTSSALTFNTWTPGDTGDTISIGTTIAGPRVSWDPQENIRFWNDKFLKYDDVVPSHPELLKYTVLKTALQGDNTLTEVSGNAVTAGDKDRLFVGQQRPLFDEDWDSADTSVTIDLATESGTEDFQTALGAGVDRYSGDPLENLSWLLLMEPLKTPFDTVSSMVTIISLATVFYTGDYTSSINFSRSHYVDTQGRMHFIQSGFVSNSSTVIKTLDTSGNLVNARIFSTSVASTFWQNTDLETDTSGNVYIIGNQTRTGVSTSGTLIKLDSSGSIVFSKKYWSAAAPVGKPFISMDINTFDASIYALSNDASSNTNAWVKINSSTGAVINSGKIVFSGLTLASNIIASRQSSLLTYITGHSFFDAFCAKITERPTGYGLSNSLEYSIIPTTANVSSNFTRLVVNSVDEGYGILNGYPATLVTGQRTTSCLMRFSTTSGAITWQKKLDWPFRFTNVQLDSSETVWATVIISSVSIKATAVVTVDSSTGTVTPQFWINDYLATDNRNNIDANARRTLQVDNTWVYVFPNDTATQNSSLGSSICIRFPKSTTSGSVEFGTYFPAISVFGSSLAINISSTATFVTSFTVGTGAVQLDSTSIVNTTSNVTVSSNDSIASSSITTFSPPVDLGKISADFPSNNAIGGKSSDPVVLTDEQTSQWDARPTFREGVKAGVDAGTRFPAGIDEDLLTSSGTEDLLTDTGTDLDMSQETAEPITFFITKRFDEDRFLGQGQNLGPLMIDGSDFADNLTYFSILRKEEFITVGTVPAPTFTFDDLETGSGTDDLESGTGSDFLGIDYGEDRQSGDTAENFSYWMSKVLTDTAPLIDNMSLFDGITYNLLLTLDMDFITIGTANTGIRNAGDAAEQVSLWFNRPVADSTLMLDNMSLFDGITYDLLQALRDSIQVGTASSGVRKSGDAAENLSYIMLKTADADRLEASDEKLLWLDKFFADSTDILDRFDLGDKLVYDFIDQEFDTVLITDEKYWWLDKNNAHVIAAVDNNNYWLGKVFTDTTTMLDRFDLGDKLVYDFLDAEFDSITVTDFVAKWLDKQFITTQDNTVFATTSAEQLDIWFNKNRTDSVSLNDLITLLLFAGGFILRDVDDAVSIIDVSIVIPNKQFNDINNSEDAGNIRCQGYVEFDYFAEDYVGFYEIFS